MDDFNNKFNNALNYEINGDVNRQAVTELDPEKL